jgi:hypothetical protein
MVTLFVIIMDKCLIVSVRVYYRPLSPVLHKRTSPRYPDFLAQSVLTLTPTPAATSDLPSTSAKPTSEYAVTMDNSLPKTGKQQQAEVVVERSDTVKCQGQEAVTGDRLLPPEAFMVSVNRHDDTPFANAPPAQGQGHMEELISMRAELEHYQQVKVRCRSVLCNLVTINFIVMDLGCR